MNAFHHLLDHTTPWYKKRRLIVLNLWIALFLITSSTSGYDGAYSRDLKLLAIIDYMNRQHDECVGRGMLL